MAAVEVDDAVARQQPSVLVRGREDTGWAGAMREHLRAQLAAGNMDAIPRGGECRAAGVPGVRTGVETGLVTHRAAPLRRTSETVHVEHVPGASAERHRVRLHRNRLIRAGVH